MIDFGMFIEEARCDALRDEYKQLYESLSPSNKAYFNNSQIIQSDYIPHKVEMCELAKSENITIYRNYDKIVKYVYDQDGAKQIRVKQKLEKKIYIKGMGDCSINDQ